MTENELSPVQEKPTICIVGDPGAGKTRLASLWPNAYFLDAEGGAASAVSPEYRSSFEVGPNLLGELTKVVNAFTNCPYQDKRILYKDQPIGALVIDSLDAIQQVHKYTNLMTKAWKEPRQMWGKLLDDIMPFVYLTRKLPIPIIWIAHVHIEEPVYQYENLRKPGFRGIATQGALEDQIKRWFDYILHIVVEEDYKRVCIVQPTVYKDYRISAAKDRHNTFQFLGRNYFSLAVDEHGFPVTKAMETIYNRHVY